MIKARDVAQIPALSCYNWHVRCLYHVRPEVPTMIEKLTLWFIFRVLLSLVPILFTSVRILTTGGAHPFGTAIERGELVLLAAAMCGGSVGLLIGSGATLLISKIISGGAAIIILMFSSLYYADVSALYRAGVPVNLRRVRQTSLVVFIAGVVFSGACVALGG